MRVIQALDFAVDRAAITRAVYGEYEAPVSRPALPGYDGYSPRSREVLPVRPKQGQAVDKGVPSLLCTYPGPSPR